MMLRNLSLLASLAFLLFAAPSAMAVGNAETTVIPIGDFAIERGQHDVRYPLAMSVAGPLPNAVVLIASQGYVEQSTVGPVEFRDPDNPFSPPVVNPQVPGTLKFKIGDRELPDWELTPKRSCYVIRWDTVRGNPAFEAAQLALSVSLTGESLALRVSVLSVPDFEMPGAEGASLSDGPMTKGVEALPPSDRREYFIGFAAEIAGNPAQAKQTYERLAHSPDESVARCARRGLRMIAYQNRPHQLSGNGVERSRWGLYLQFCGLLGNAFREFDQARIIDLARVEDQFRAAECLERIGGETLNVAAYFNRIDDLLTFDHPAIWRVLVVITHNREGRTLSDKEIINIKDTFVLLDRVLAAASRGAIRLAPSFHERVKEEPELFSRHLDRVSGPSEKLITDRGWYDMVYYIRPRADGEDRNFSESGWTDVGPNGAALTTLFHDAPFSVYLRTFYGQLFAAASIVGQAHGWPDPVAVASCGYHPARFTGSAVRSAMRFYLSPAELARLTASDAPTPYSYLKLWRLEGPVAVTTGGATGALGLMGDEWPDGSPAAIRELVCEEDFVDLAHLYPSAGAAKIRATSWVFSPKKQSVWIRMGRNDQASLRLNGRRVLAAPSLAGGKFEGRNLVDTAFTRETLEEGWNEVQVMVASRPSERNSGWGFSVSIVTPDKSLVPGLACVAQKPSERLVPAYSGPKAGNNFSWNDVRDDFRRRLPCLTNDDLKRITGDSDLQIQMRAFESGKGFIAFESDSMKAGPTYRPATDWKDADGRDVVLNNLLDWSREAVAALHYGTGTSARDLLLVRPEALDAVLELLKEPASASEVLQGRRPSERLLGWIDFPPYGCVFVLSARLSDDGTWPVDEEDILSPIGPFVPNWPAEFLEGPPYLPPEDPASIGC